MTIFSIQQGPQDVMVWCRRRDGSRACMKLFATVAEAEAFVTYLKSLPWNQ